MKNCWSTRLTNALNTAVPIGAVQDCRSVFVAGQQLVHAAIVRRYLESTRNASNADKHDLVWHRVRCKASPGDDVSIAGTMVPAQDHIVQPEHGQW